MNRNCLHTIYLNDKSYIAAETLQHATFIIDNSLFLNEKVGFAEDKIKTITAGEVD